MSVERLKRVLWRIQEWKVSDGFSRKQLRRAIMLECGTTEVTIKNAIRKMEELKMIKHITNARYKITDDNPI